MVIKPMRRPSVADHLTMQVSDTVSAPSITDIPSLLSVRGVGVRFGGIVALDGVSFEVPQGKITGLIGPNGAGKTTLFNCLSRLYEFNEGKKKKEGKK